MKKFYRYLIYKLFSWRIDKKDDTPIATVIFLITITHIFQLLILYSIIGKIFPKAAIFDSLPKIYVGIFFVIFTIVNYFVLYNKTRWQEYIEEFKSETAVEKKWGSILVTTYLLGSVFLFFILMPVLFGV
jgi:hypothetical protein